MSKIRTMEESKASAEKWRDQWLDKLWQQLFDGESAGLLSPGQIRRERRKRLAVRQLEMAAIYEAEQELNLIHSGLKSIDFSGRIVDTPVIDNVSTHSVIIDNSIDESFGLNHQTAATLLKSAAKDVAVRDLERSLNVKKIILLAETEIYQADPCPVSHNLVSAEWLAHWKTAAEQVYNPEIQILLAKILIKEIASPNAYAISTLHVLTLLSPEEFEMLSILAKFSFGRFIVNVSSSYFATDLYQTLLDVMDDLGMISGFDLAPTYMLLPSEGRESYIRYLYCGNKALKVTHAEASKALKLAVFKVSRAARELLPLYATASDLAYLNEVAILFKKQGFDVALGEWDSITHTFSLRMAL